MKFSALAAPAMAAAMCLLAVPVMAQSSAKPGGPWVTPEQTISLEAFHTYEELTDRLLRIEKRSKGLVQVESIGQTGQGRDIWLAKVGNPSNTPVMVITQQHGDEPHGTETALEMIQFLGTGSASARKILDELYVLMVPRVNPDGGEIPTRGNADFLAAPRSGCACPAAGGINPNCRGIFTTRFRDTDDFSYDINRYHWPDWSDSWQFLCNPLPGDPGFAPVNPVPEAVAVLDTYAAYRPIWVIDVHNQGFNVIEDGQGVNRDGRRVTGSLEWPTNADVDERARDFSKQMAIVMKKRSLEIGHMEINRFGGGTFPGIARNGYGLLGSERLAAGEAGPLGGSILIEIEGQIEGSVFINLGQKAIGKLKQNVRQLLTSVLEATADGSILEENPDQAETLLLVNDTFLPNPRAGEE